MSNKILLPICWLSLAGILVGLASIFFPSYELGQLERLSALVFFMSTTYLLLKNDGFLNSSYFKWVMLSLSLLLIGVMFKIMHWPFAAQLFLLSLCSVSICYLLYFLSNKNKAPLDWVKLIFVLTFSSSRAFIFMRWPYSDILNWLSLLLLAAALVLFTFPDKKRNPNVLDN